MTSARFVLLTIADPVEARAWLGSLKNDLTSAETKPAERAVNVAFTPAGLKRLGLPASCLEGFSREFIEGMDTPHRRRVLGDTTPDSPTKRDRSPDTWDWGNRADAENGHVLLIMYAKGWHELTCLDTDQKSRYKAAGLVEHRTFDPLHLTGRTEHFGFRDGIAQPFVENVEKEAPLRVREKNEYGNSVPPGEILLGYPNAYGTLPPSPVDATGASKLSFDFGEHGSYLVVRQLSQDVKAFWDFLIEVAGPPGPDQPAGGAAVELASKMVGRWPSGVPLALSSRKNDPLAIDEDEYAYDKLDPLGLITPIGSHTRRSNPRDSLEPGPAGEGRLSASDSLAVTKLHRIIRRGRPYGKPVADSMQPADIVRALAADSYPKVDRGLLFLCFNANIARQFEFIQQTWIDNPKFGGLYEDSDPLMGNREPKGMTHPADVFTQQATPVRRRINNLPDFVRVLGGGYFFMPGLEAVQHLAGLDTPCG